MCAICMSICSTCSAFLFVPLAVAAIVQGTASLVQGIRRRSSIITIILSIAGTALLLLSARLSYAP
jgi:hypothetical protein